ncbi:Calcium-binding allergen Ole e [Dorcoceras hygrometricum]|uniref:Calcium-binding allergen Ole e n=1 Tax=Dorcoceras hygrometricum TaxID=472368 RepID=A0A2Z7DD39_9LAMI|nr:Calcium-binding allergen Ole e [Dorcoceras hygrometricum]
MDGGGMSIELQSDFSKEKSGNISSDELTDCTRSVDAKISRAGRSIELQSDFSKEKSGNISSDELTDCTRSVDAKISRAGRG